VIVEHRYDLWLLPLDGGAGKLLTNGVGSRQETKFTLARTQPIDPTLPRAERDPRVYDLGKSVTLAPMTPFERKIVHDAIAEAGLRSESEGEEPNRRVVVHPA
jgi:hypothetical protein